MTRVKVATHNAASAELTGTSPSKENAMNHTESALTALVSDLQPEELEPRLEMQILLDPLAMFADGAVDNNCRDGGCCTIWPDRTDYVPCK